MIDDQVGQERLTELLEHQEDILWRNCERTFLLEVHRNSRRYVDLPLKKRALVHVLWHKLQAGRWD